MAAVVNIEATVQAHGQQISSLVQAIQDLSVSVQRISSTQAMLVKRMNQAPESPRSALGKGAANLSPEGLQQEISELKWQMQTLDSKMHSHFPNDMPLATQRDLGAMFLECREESREVVLSENQSLIKDMTELQVKWSDTWLKQAESGELDIYTCLGLSGCFTWTPETRKLAARVFAVLMLQMLVPFVLLTFEFSEGVKIGPAQGDMGFRLVAASLYGYALYSMYNGAQDSCRTDLMNLCFQYPNVGAGNWVPLVAGEVSNVFTAVVLVVSLYSIFTNQKKPADLILNAVAVNFLGDVDAHFVGKEMKHFAVRSFKEFSANLFTTERTKVCDPSAMTWVASIMKRSLQLFAALGAFGCISFVFYPVHAD